MREEEVVRHVAAWLTGQSWNVLRAQHTGPGFDIKAEKNGCYWLIEAKGEPITNEEADLPNQRLYFNFALGYVLNNYRDTTAKYSIALPDIPGYRGLWNNAPAGGRYPVASCLFVSVNAVLECI